MYKVILLWAVAFCVAVSAINESCSEETPCPWHLKCNKETSKCECHKYVCPRGCPGEYELDDEGCQTCLCKGCEGLQCRKWCFLGFTTDENGCESFCTCNTPSTVCKNFQVVKRQMMSIELEEQDRSLWGFVS
uniref:Putative therostasin-like protein n=1 Tax=Haementeria vizottoi TaxID=1628691 RepID=A0A0N7Z9P2_9ANNE